MAAHVIPVCVRACARVCVCVCVCVHVRARACACMCVWCGVNSNLFTPHHTHLIRNYICGHIYEHFITTTHYYIVFCHFSNS